MSASSTPNTDQTSFLEGHYSRLDPELPVTGREEVSLPIDEAPTEPQPAAWDPELAAALAIDPAEAGKRILDKLSRARSNAQFARNATVAQAAPADKRRQLDVNRRTEEHAAKKNRSIRVAGAFAADSVPGLRGEARRLYDQLARAARFVTALAMTPGDTEVSRFYDDYYVRPGFEQRRDQLRKDIAKEQKNRHRSRAA